MTINVPNTPDKVRDFTHSRIDAVKERLQKVGRKTQSSVLSILNYKLSNESRFEEEYFNRIWIKRTTNEYCTTLLEQIADELETKNK